MGFEDCLRNCCEQNLENDDPMAGFKEPDLWRYLNAPLAFTAWGDLTSTVDFDYKETKTGIKVTQVSSPLIPEPSPMGILSSQRQTPPLRQLQQASDQVKQKDANKEEDRSDQPNNHDFDSLKPLSDRHHGEPSRDKSEEGSRRQR